MKMKTVVNVLLRKSRREKDSIENILELRKSNYIYYTYLHNYL